MSTTEIIVALVVVGGLALIILASISPAGGSSHGHHGHDHAHGGHGGGHGHDHGHGGGHH